MIPCLIWSRLPELNRRPSNYESDALPTELSRLFKKTRGALEELHYTNPLIGVSSSEFREDANQQFALQRREQETQN